MTTQIADFTWFVACTPPTREKAAVDRLTDEGIACLLPVRHLWRRKNRYQKTKELKSYPLIPGYVMVGVGVYRELSALWGLPNLINGFIAMDGRALSVRPNQVQRLVDWGSQYTPPTAHKYMKTHKEFAEGDRVMVTDGPLTDQIFTVEKIVGNKAHVLLELFNMSHDVELTLDALAAL